MATDGKKRHVVSYENMSEAVAEAFAEKYPRGFNDYLDDLVKYLKELGYRAITYMPSRNTRAQLTRVMDLCEKHSFTQISGEDINSPSQSFICKELADPQFAHLVDAAWKLIEREKEG